MHQQTLDRPLQMARAVLEVRSFGKQETLTRIGQSEDEHLVVRDIEDPLLNQVQFDVQDLLQLLGSERLEGHDLHSVHELGSELPPRRGHSAASELGAFSWKRTTLSRVLVDASE